MHREPLCLHWALPSVVCRPAAHQRALPRLHRSYWLMRQTESLLPISVPLIRQVFAGCCQSQLGDGPSRHYSCNPCAGAWPHTPRCSPAAHAHFFTGNNGLHASGTRSAHTKHPRNATSTGNRFSVLQTFRYVQAPALARPPGCTHRSIHMLGGQALYTTHSPVGCLPWDVASLHARFGQLTWLDFHQLDCSLVGCSFPHPALQQNSLNRRQ